MRRWLPVLLLAVALTSACRDEPEPVSATSTVTATAAATATGPKDYGTPLPGAPFTPRPTPTPTPRRALNGEMVIDVTTGRINPVVYPFPWPARSGGRTDVYDDLGDCRFRAVRVGSTPVELDLRPGFNCEVLSVSPDGRSVLALVQHAVREWSAHLVDLDSGTRWRLGDVPTHGADGIRWSPDSAYVATKVGGEWLILERDSRERIRAIQNDVVVFLRDGDGATRLIARSEYRTTSGSTRTTVSVVDVRSGEARDLLDENGAVLGVFELGPDVLSGRLQPDLRVNSYQRFAVDVRDGRRLRLSEAHSVVFDRTAPPTASPPNDRCKGVEVKHALLREVRCLPGYTDGMWDARGEQLALLSPVLPKVHAYYYESYLSVFTPVDGAIRQVANIGRHDPCGFPAKLVRWVDDQGVVFVFDDPAADGSC